MNTIPHVCHVVLSLRCGGLERLVVDWTNARNARAPGSTEILCLDEAGELAAQVDGGSVRCVAAQRTRFPWDRDAVRAIRKAVREVAAPAGGVSGGILHAHNMAAWQYAVLAAAGATRDRRCGEDATKGSCVAGAGSGIRVIYTQHGANPHNRGLVNRLRAAWLRARTDVVCAVSDATAASMARDMRMPRQQIHTVPNGIRIEPPDAAARAVGRHALGIGEEEFAILYLGRLSREKGCDRLVRAFADSEASSRTARLVLIGDGQEREALERLAAERGVADRVLFAGFRADARSLLTAGDLFVLPSRSEGLPVALLEALAAGVPAAATAVGDVARVLDDGRAGILLPDDDAQWPALLAGLLADARAGRLVRNVAAASELVARRYSLAATAEAYERLYETARL